MIKNVCTKIFSTKNVKKIKNNIMDVDELRKGMNKLMDFIDKEYKSYEDTSIDYFSTQQPGALKKIYQNNLPEKGKDISSVIDEFKNNIFKGMRHWQHPMFNAYFPAQVSHPMVIADTLISSFQSIILTYHSSPSETELETIVVDWMVDLLNLPKKFKFSSNLGGGGIITKSIGESLIISIKAAIYKKENDEKYKGTDIKNKLVAYSTTHSNVIVKRAAFILGIKNVRELPVKYSEKLNNFTCYNFQEMVEDDIKNGLIPCFVAGTLGTTCSGSTDDFELIKSVSKKYDIFSFIDAAWAGPFMMIDKFKEFSQTLDVNAFACNPSKMMLSGINATFYVTNDASLIPEALSGSKLKSTYLDNEFSDMLECIDYKEWSISLGRRTEAMKLFFVIKTYGKVGLQLVLQNSIDSALYFKNLVLKNECLEIFTDNPYSLVCLRIIKLKDRILTDIDELNKVNRELLKIINDTKLTFIVGSDVNDIFFIRFSFSPCTNVDNQRIDYLYSILKESIEVLNQRY